MGPLPLYTLLSFARGLAIHTRTLIFLSCVYQVLEDNFVVVRDEARSSHLLILLTSG